MKTNILFIITCALILFGCEGKEGKAGERGPAGPQGDLLTGDIVGRVEVYDSTGYRTNSDSVTITLEGTNYTTKTDSLGGWRLTDVKTGTYVISAFKETYSIYKNTSFQFVGGRQPAYTQRMYLYKIPTNYVKQISTNGFINDEIIINGILLRKNINTNYDVLTFFLLDSINQNITSKNTLFVYNNYAYDTDTFSIKMKKIMLNSFGLPKGRPIYFVSFLTQNVGYYDVVNDENIHSGLSQISSNILSVKIP